MAGTPDAASTVDVGGKSVLRFHPTHEKIKDGTVRCISCGQIDEVDFHDARWCPAMGGDLPFATSTIKLALKADNGFRLEMTARITLAQYRAIMMIVNADPRVSRPIYDQDKNVVGTNYCEVLDLLSVEGFMDEDGTVWTPPTAYAYSAACRALRNARATPKDSADA